MHLTTGLCAGVALEFRPPVTAARLFDKDKYLEPMFGDVGHARTNAAILLMPIATTSSRTCTKPNVIRLCFYQINLRVQLVEEIIMFLFVGFGVAEFYNMSISKTH